MFSLPRRSLAALHGGNAEHGLRDAVLEAAEPRVAHAHGHPADFSGDHAAHGVARRLRREDRRALAFGIRLAADALGARLHGHALLREDLQHDAARDAQGRREAAREVSAAGHVLEAAEAHLRGPVGVAGTRHGA